MEAVDNYELNISNTNRLVCLSVQGLYSPRELAQFSMELCSIENWVNSLGEYELCSIENWVNSLGEYGPRALSIHVDHGASK